LGARFFVEWCISFQRRKRARKEQEDDKLGSRVMGKHRGTNGRWACEIRIVACILDWK
jgi:hypothetical protein